LTLDCILKCFIRFRYVEKVSTDGGTHVFTFMLKKIKACTQAPSAILIKVLTVVNVLLAFLIAS